LLSRYSQETDVVFGATVSGRPPSLVGIESMVGLFINTLPVRVQVSAETKVLGLLKDLQMQQIESEQFSYSSLVEIQGCSDVPRGTPLFESIVVFENHPVDAAITQGNDSFSLSNLRAIERTNYPLTVVAAPGKQLLVKISYDASRFDDATITRMLDHFVTLLEAIVANPQARIGELPLLREVERQQLLVEWNSTQTDYPQDKCIHQLFEQQVARTPDAVAVVFDNQQLTYSELNCRANQLAHHLKSLGVGADVLVGLCVERSPLMIVGMLGILKAGGAYVPLDPEYPQARLSFMLEDAQVRVLLTQHSLLDRLPEHTAQHVCLDTDAHLIEKFTQDNAIAFVQANNLAYVMYTSGSTGQPKGVEVVHRSVNRLLFGVNYVELDATQRFLQLAPISFDASTFEIWGALLHGAKCVLFPGSIPTSQNLGNEIKKHGITVLWLTAALFNSIIDDDEQALSGIKQLLIGGEALSVVHVQKALAALPLTQIINGYGPTESTTFSCCYPIPRQIEATIESIPIGRAIANTQVYILDSHLQPVPIGVPGELYLGGAGLARGYLNRSQLTQEKFIANPFEETQSSRLYKTGDLGRYLPDGNIEYLGRIDNQVKIRGLRIELGEIETVLSQHGDVQANCVIAREDNTGDKQLVAYIVAQPEATPKISELRQFLKAKLPDYMLPQAFVILEALPLTLNGKIDHRALPTPDLESIRLEKYVAPRTPVEEILTQIWAQVLKVEQIGIHDNFFEIGGHSLLATQLVSRIRTCLKVELPLRKLFGAATVAQLAHLIAQLQQQNSQLSAPPIVPRTENAQLALSYAQQRLWFLDQFEPDSPFYNIPIALCLAGTVQVAALEQSLIEIIKRHEALRTNFITVDGQPTQIIQTQTNWRLSVVDLQHLSTNEQEIAAQKLAQQQAQTPFDLANESLITATLVVQSQTKHILSVCMHHIVCDGWSMGVFVQELAALYNAYSIGQPSPLAPLEIQYADFAIWQRNWLVGEVLQNQLSYWQQQLKDAPALLSLPSDRPRPAVQTFAGAYQEFRLSVELTTKLTKLSQQQGVTLFMTLLAAFDTLVYRYTGTEDILVGTPIANRDRSEIEGLIGFFVNTLVMRTDLSGNPSFSQLLSRVRSMAMDAYAHQNLPFEMLVEALQPERELSHSPLFQVMFALQNASISEVELTGLSVTSLPIETATAKFDLTLSMENTPEGLMGVWEYSTDLFDKSTIERMMGHFVTLLEGIVANPTEQISTLPMLTESERQQLLVEWNDTLLDYPHDKCIHQLFSEQVERTPDAVAVVFENVQTRNFASLTYRQLNCRANQLAHHLKSLGVGADVLVGLCVERSLEMIVGLLGILKAGGAYVPLDPEYPTERLSFMLEDAQLKLVLTQQQLVERLPLHTAHLVCLDTDWQKIASHSQSNPLNTATTSNLAYVIYTSGSTGKPKGVLVNHSNVVRLFAATNSWYNFNSQDVCTLFHSIAFDFSVWEMWSALLYGGRLIVVPYLVTRSPESFYELLCQQKVTILNQTPSAFRQLIQAEQAIATVGKLNLRLVIFGGEALEPLSLQPWFERHDDQSPQLVNMYGITETTVHVTYRPLSKADLNSTASLIGRPIPDLQIYLLDEYLQPVPIGVPAQMYVGGAGVTRGYLNRPELTQQRFISNPFNNSKLYKTGDLARYLPNGDLEYLGRIDNQVKIRGFRIELGEIESLLTSHPDVWESVVVIREEQPGDKRLVAYIVPNTGQSLTASQLRQFLANQLPDYMLPQAFVLLEALPLTLNGKIDHRALPTPDLESIRLEKYVAPRTPVEEILTQIWAQVLKVEQIGIHDNFFEIGGHSLLATQLVSRIRTCLKVELPLRKLFGAATVAQLAHLIAQLQQQNSQLSAPPIVPRTENAQLALSYAQQRLWFLDQFEPDSPFYNIPIALCLAGTVQVAALEQSLIEIIKRHEALRTNFITVDGQPTQIIQTQTNWRLSVVDLQHLSTNEQEIAAQKLAQQQAQTPFDLANESLITATLVVQSQTKHILSVCMHHIVCDGWSMGVFVQELAALYNAYSIGQPSPLAPLEIQYADFAIWQRNWLVGEVLQNQLSYWQQQLKDAPALLSLPSDRPRPAVQTFAGAYQEFRLSVELTTKLTKLSQQQGVTLFMTLLAAFDTLVYRYTGTEDILVGTPIANRDRSEIEGLIGFFVNTLVMRTDLSGNPSFSQLLSRVRSMAMDAYAHQNLPFEMLVEALQPERELSHSPLFQVMFALQNASISEVELTGLSVTSLPIETATAKFDLTLSMENTPEGLMGVWEYSTDLFDKSTIERMMGHFVTLLEGIVANPTEQISTLPMLTESERQQLLVEWNDTLLDYPHDKCIHQLFSEQVERTPDAVAVVFENVQTRNFASLTYRQLNCRANQLAHHLKSLGVGADVLVGLCVERSLEMIVGLLGILKAGGAYVPLDPEYPTERLSFMLEDAQLKLVLTQQQLVEKLPLHTAHLVCLDTDWQKIAQLSDSDLVNDTSSKNLAYIIYTSGSTGQPKGVMIQHQSLVNFTQTAISEYGLSNCDRILQFSSISFDVAAEEIYPCLSCGATLVLRTDEMLNSVQMFVQKCRDWNLTVLDLPTAYWHQLAFELASANLLLPDAIRLIIIGGELPLEQRLKMWQQHIGNYPQIINAYGPTETTVEATLCKLLDPLTTETDQQKIAIGRPIYNTQIYILDKYLQPVPIGVPGELHIGGAGLAHGYLNRSELTQEKFISNPFQKGRGALEIKSRGKTQGQSSNCERLYKTGDLARYLPDGNIEYLGRIDNQVKIRSFRIELGEIEAVLSQHDNVQANCVIAREDIRGDKQLVAYVVPQPQTTTKISELRQFLKAKLPDYMLPQAFVMLESLPLTPNGKLDKNALPTSDLDSIRLDKYVAPRTPVEEMMALIWVQVLKLEQVGIHDNFFEVGGHSLLATQLVSRIRNCFKVELPLRELFAAPTVGELAKEIEQLQQQDLKLTAPPILRRAKDVQLPLSFAQQRLWFLDQFEPNSALYNIPIALRLAGILNQAALEQSLQEIISRHEALRTNLIAVDGQPIQIIHTQTTWTLSVIELQHLPTSEKEIATQQLVQQLAIQQFDLASESLFRATLIILSETEQILLVCMHHIVSDGWSTGVFIRELAVLYNAYAQDQPSLRDATRSLLPQRDTLLTPLPIQYADFALWQRDWLVADVLQSQLNYWQQQLKDAPALLVLPSDRPRPAVQTFTGAYQEFALSVELTDKLTKLSQEQGVTLFMTLLAAFDTLLYRYTEQSDILVGTPIANRDRSEIEGLIGFFVNTLVMRTDLSGNPNFSELLTRVREMTMDAYAHQNLPFEMLVEALQPERDLSHSPLFQVMFVLQNAPISQLELTGLTVSPIKLESATAPFDLTLSMENTPQGLMGVWEYNTDLFDSSTIERMIGHFVTLLCSIVANPQERIEQLPMLAEVEQQQLLVEWNDTQVDYPFDQCLHQLFEQQVELTPDAVAVVFDNVQTRNFASLTYQQLNTQANQLAHYLKSLGVGTETLVGIYLERSLSMIVALLAVLKAGGAYVPLDPDYPQQRLADISQDSQLSVLITQQTLLNSLPIKGVKVIVLDTESLVLTLQSPENPVNQVRPENLTCILYTSGSTGKPKGVMLTHAALVIHSCAISEVFGLTSADRVLQFASLGFDVAAEEIFPTWYKGATVVLRPAQMFPDFASFAQFIEQQKLSVLNITPAYWHEWAVAVSKEDATVPQSLRLVAVGGDAVLPETVTIWQQLVGDRINCLNVYGPTEASVTAIVHDLLHPKFSKTNTVLIGRPIANTQAYILDRHLQPVPIGVIGELHIGGVRLARGYLNRPELTDEKFLANTFKDPKCDSLRPTGGHRIYKTGDLARYLPDGKIECFGRIDNQVKIRGFRIELGEIEAVLNQHLQVQTSCVIIREDTTRDKRLVAYVVPYSQDIPTLSELRQFLSNSLPLYMVPNAFVVLESLPLTPNRKVDRRALPTPDLHSEQIDNYVAPRNPVEEMLAQIWAQVLKLEQVGIHDNFFTLGGHSLLATQLVSRIRNTFKVELPLRSLFAAATVAQLARAIEQLQQQDLELTAPPILPRTENAELPLSFAQQRLWFLEQLQPNSELYNIPLALRIVGTLNIAALEQSLIEIIARHEALRTNFITVNGQATQVIQTQTNWTLSIVELQHLSTSEQEIVAQQLAQQQALQPFDLATQVLVRATLIVLSQTEYVLSVCMHHIVSDDWSISIFVQELATLYNAYSQGQFSPLTPLPIQYADFAMWQRQWLVGDVQQNQLSYWQQQLANAPTLLSLPTDRPRPAVQTFAGAHQKFELSLELTDKLIQLSQQQGVTLFMTLLAAFDTLLYRYTGQSDILVGTPIANRNHSEIEGLIGFFVNTLVMRTDLSENPSFSSLLTRVREMALGAYAHQDLPFEMLVEVLQPERNLSHTPLFQVMFVLQNAPMSEVELSGLTISDLPTESVTAKFDLTLVIGNTATGLVGVWEYNTDLFDPSTIARMLGHFVTLLEAIVANPQARIGELPLLREVERQQLLVEWNSTQTDYPSDKCIHQLFEQQVARTPDAVAVVFDNQQLTYSELNCRANQLAHHLKSLGVDADVLVGLCIERSPLMIVGMLGILKAGGAYVPLDPEYPQARLSFMLEDTQVKVLLTQHNLVESLPQHQAHVICLDTQGQIISLANQDNLNSTLSAENLSYVIYTSGSTGTPKGVAVTHQAVNRLVFNTNYIHLTADECIAQAANIAFDAATFEIWGALLHGAKLVIISKSILLSPQEFALHLRSDKVSVLFLTTALFNQLASVVPQAFSCLKYLLFGGEAVDCFWVQQVLEKGAPQQLLHVYGPTENTTFSSWYLVEQLPTKATTIPIGRAIANTQVYILDSHLQPVPIGVPGELYLGGAGLARGYLNRSQLTQQKFLTNPFEETQGSKLYKTGDLARYLADGNIEYLGRIDNQVKIRGLRIELAEIETVLSQHGDVQANCVIAREDIRGDKQLVAYIVPQPEVIPKISQLRQFLKAKLPDYMLPQAFVMLEALPLTPNGKIDHRALPTPDLNTQIADKFIAPRNPIEETLALIWAQVLRLEQVGIHDNFFELGGHSLLATQVISRLQEAFGTSLLLRYLFESPTIAQLSEVISSELQTNSGLTVPPIVPVSRDADIPLSWAQERLWFVHHLEGETGAYTIPFAMRLLGNLNVKALEQALQAMVQRHEVLRTQFEIKNNKPIQAIAQNITITMPVVDLQNLPDPWKQVKQQVEKEVCKPFDLVNGPVVRAVLWQVAIDEYVFVLAIHHIAADGWSVGILIRELSAYYQSISTGSSMVLPELPVQYADFSVWQRQWLTTQVLGRQLSYWKQQLAGAPPLIELPTDRPRPAIQTFRGGTERFQLDDKLTQQLRQISQESGSTLFMTLLAGFVVLLSRYSGQTDLVVGSPIANRNRKEIEGLIGFFVNTLALRFDLSQEPTFEALLAQVRQVTQNAYDHQDLPFEMLVEELQVERNLDRNPLVQVLFALQNAATSPWDLPGLRIEEVSWELDSVRFDLEVHFWEAPEGLEGFCFYNKDLFDAATIARMMQHFQTLLVAIIANPQQPVSLLPLLTQHERHQLLEEWNNTQADYQNKCIHQLFEEQVARTPDAVAVVFENVQTRVFASLTYQQLNCRANQLAHYLRSLGVEADVLVGICVERSLLMLVGLLGILKAGGAYVPLEPTYPQERLAYMLNDSQVQVLLTQEKFLTSLPEHGARVVCLDTDWGEIGAVGEDNPVTSSTIDKLAYVIYTSGSTGKPKGAMNTHLGICNRLLWMQQAYQLTPADCVLQKTPFSFDVSVWEFFWPLLNGARLVVAKPGGHKDSTYLVNLILEQQITTLHFVPSMLQAFIEEQNLKNCSSLKRVICSGEALPLELQERFFTRLECELHNLYGPTEAAIDVTSWQCQPHSNLRTVPIGRAIANTQIYILDSHLQPVPIGVPGELHISGVGLARGYLNRPDLTNEKFIPNPFEKSGESRLYKTGDLARYLPDGNIEYLERIDNQVKIRGFRIELGEIEAVLSQHPLIQESVVVARADNTGDKRLVAYLVPTLHRQALPQEVAQWQSEYVSDWQMLYEQAYSQPQASTDDLTFNIISWNSSYTKQPIPTEEMHEWVESTVSRIMAVEPKRVLEIGCGTGLLLFRIAKNCQQYWGTDYSIAAIQYVEQVCDTVEGLENVQLLHQMADNFAGIPQAEFDTVILNSVVQYFPSVEYLLQVLEGAMATIGDRGTLFVGDVRSLSLLESYHAAVQFSQADESRSIEQWQRMVHSSVAAEEELVIDPRFFIALKHRFPQIAWLEIQPKRGDSQNELTQFRYDVTLHVDANVQASVRSEAEATVVPWLNWQLDKLSLAQIQNQLHVQQPQLLGIRRVPNQRVQQALQIWQWLENPPNLETVSQLRQLLAQQSTIGINPEEFWELGQELGYTVHLSWWEGSQDGCYDVVLCRNSSTQASDKQDFDYAHYKFWDTSTLTTKPWTDYTNNPLHGKLVQKLVPQVREFIQQKLPNYMVPQAFVLLNALPLTHNGKVDRRALPTPDTASRNLSTGFVSPRTPIEAQLAQIWSEVLGLERIGVKDNFFELGGHSLLATQVISRINSAFGLDLSIQMVFESPTVAGIASYMEVVDLVTQDLSVKEVSKKVVEF
jgi:amino acid adenylation domain-containing protein